MCAYIYIATKGLDESLWPPMLSMGAPELSRLQTPSRHVALPTETHRPTACRPEASPGSVLISRL